MLKQTDLSFKTLNCNNQGPVVQIAVSILTSSKYIHIFAKKCE